MSVKPPSVLFRGQELWEGSNHNAKDVELKAEDFDFSGINAADFSRYRFLGTVKFIRCTFKSGTTFVNAVFMRHASFEGCVFLGDVSFQSAQFFEGVTFEGARFHGPCDLIVEVAGNLTLNGAEFQNAVVLGSRRTDTSLKCSDATFAADVRVQGDFRVLFLRDSTFRARTHVGVSVSQVADLSGSDFTDSLEIVGKFHGGLYLRSGECEGGIFVHDCEIRYFLDCMGRRFGKHASFVDGVQLPGCIFTQCHFEDEARFDGRRFTGTTSFRDAVFRVAPAFHSCEFFSATEFRGARFEDWTSEWAETCYRSLRHCCKKIEATADELLFFGHEMRARRAREKSRGLRSLFLFYEWTSGYGLSILRPIGWFIGMQIGFALGYWLIDLLEDRGLRACLVDVECAFDSLKAQRLFSFTLAQALPFIPALKDFPVAEIWSRPFYMGLAQTLAVVHGLVSVVLLFLVGLGLRNLFRVR